MGRRKASCVLPLSSGGSYEGRSSTEVCTREFLQQKYDEAVLENRPTTLYAETTIYHVDRIKDLFTEYCALLELDPRGTLKECITARIETFLHWMLKTYTIKKTSTVTTYWRQLSQLHIIWWHCRIGPDTLKQIFVFIEGPLTKEYGLDNSETEKPLLEADDFVEVLQYHWASDINIFPNERQRVQVAAILLLAAFTGSRPAALLNLEYRDLDLYVEKNHKGQHVLKLGVRLTKTKSRQKRKRPKTYTFNLDDNPVFCIISHIASLAFNDDAFIHGLQSPAQLFQLRVKRHQGCQRIPWRKEMLDKPIFRRPILDKGGVRTSDDLALPYAMYHSWVKRLGEALGYLQTLTTYCLRRALGNAINDDPNSNSAVRNLALDHTGSMMFERNYLSRVLRYSTQDAYWGRPSDSDSSKAASRIGRLRDPRRPRKLTEKQNQQVRRERLVKKLYDERDRLRAQVLSEYGVIKMAEGEPIYKDYQALRRTLHSTIRAEERALLKRTQEEYDTTAPVIDIQRQLDGEDSSDDDDVSESVTVPLKFVERRRIAEAAFCGPSAFAPEKGFSQHIAFCNNIIGLCKRRERQRWRPKKYHSACRPSPGTAKAQRVIPNSEPKENRNVPLNCEGFQCLFCLADSKLPAMDRECDYASKFSLQRHTNRWHLNKFETDEEIPCPDDLVCSGVVLESETHFKNHAKSVHDFSL